MSREGGMPALPIVGRNRNFRYNYFSQNGHQSA
jgi:hypothetical protein